MSTSRPVATRIAFVAAASFALACQAAGPERGQPLSEAEIPVYARYIMPNGEGLPPGKGTAKEGEALYKAQCASCHGATGQEGPIMPPVAPGKDYAKSAGQYWPHATTLFDYIRRAMPFATPKSLSDDQVYALTAYLLWRNGVIAEGAQMDAQSLPKVKMPGREKMIHLWDKQRDKPY